MPRPRFEDMQPAIAGYDADGAVADLLTKSYNGYAQTFGWPQAGNKINAAEEGAGLGTAMAGVAKFAMNPRQVGRGLTSMGEFAEAAMNSDNLQQAISPLTGLMDRDKKVNAPRTPMPPTRYQPNEKEAGELRSLMDAKRAGTLQRPRPDLPRVSVY